MKRGDKIWLIIVAVALLSALAGGYFEYLIGDWAEILPPVKFVSAHVEVGIPRAPYQYPDMFDVTDPVQVNHLASFFPGVGRRSKSFVGANWPIGFTVDFKRVDGRVVHVEVTNFEHENFWCQGPEPDSLEVRGDFEAYFERLHKAVASSAGRASRNGGEQ